MSDASSHPPDPATVACRRCGARIALAQADLAADGYRCLSCSTDEKIETSVAEQVRDAERDGIMLNLRIQVLGALLFSAIAASTQGAVRWTMAAAVLGLVAWLVSSVRRLVR